MVAVSSESEIPKISDDKTSYVGFQSVIKSALVFMIIGIILALFDVLDMIYLMTDFVGSISVKFMEIIKRGVT